MGTHTAPSQTLPFDLGETRSFGGLTVFPLFASEPAPGAATIEQQGQQIDAQ
jgi:hypothetical protein